MTLDGEAKEERILGFSCSQWTCLGEGRQPPESQVWLALRVNFIHLSQTQEKSNWFEKNSYEPRVNLKQKVIFYLSHLKKLTG